MAQQKRMPGTARENATAGGGETAHIVTEGS